MEEKEIQPELISAYQFAARKLVSEYAVYRRIRNGEIDTVPVGKYNFIDWNKYSHIEFPHAAKQRKSREAKKGSAA